LEIEIAKRDKEARDWIRALIVLFFMIGGGAGFIFIVEAIVKIEPASRQLGRSNLSKEKKKGETGIGRRQILASLVTRAQRSRPRPIPVQPI
jgi:hypothetical protein